MAKKKRQTRPVIIEPSYHELHVRFARPGEQGLLYTGASGLFETTPNRFKSPKAAADFLRRNRTTIEEDDVHIIFLDDIRSNRDAREAFGLEEP